MGENSLDEKAIFRLSVILYADENYNSQRDSIIRKILESLFVDNNEGVTVCRLVERCQQEYGLYFSEDEINKVITNSDKFIIKRGSGNELTFSLEENRLCKLKEQKTKGLDEFLVEFCESVENVTLAKVKDIIYKFLYEIFTSNLNSYAKFLNRENIFDKFSVENSNYSDEDKVILNKFIKYDNEKKDKAIFDIVSLALEYCIISGSDKQIYTQGIRNKIFYLDTNIIYRAIGVNGEERKVLTLKFIEKCNSCNIKLKVSKFTNEEFSKSLQHYSNNIKKYKHGNLNYNIYDKYCKGSDMYKFYYEWQSNRANKDIEFFVAYVKSMYSEFVNKFHIEEDYTEYMKGSKDQVKEKIQNCANSIGGFKEGSIDSSNEFDAKNIIMIEEIRKNANENGKKFLETKHFFISTDQKLREWNYLNKAPNNQPIVMLPSQWLSIILRFTSRTNDDFKSFVSFLSLKKNENIITSEKFNAILCGISEITEDIKKQEKYASEIIELKANNIINLEDTNEVYSETMKYVKESMDEIVSTAQKEVAIMENEKSRKEEIIISERREKEESLEKQKKLMKKLIQKDVDIYMSKWRKNSGYYLVLVILIILYGILHFVFQDQRFNIVSKLWKWAGNDEAKKWGIGTLSTLICTTVLGLAVHQLYIRLNKRSNGYKEKFDKIYNDVEKSIKE